jgi:hypothetical protein
MLFFTSTNAVTLLAVATCAVPVLGANWDFKGYFPGTGCNRKANVEHGGKAVAGCARGRFISTGSFVLINCGLSLFWQLTR